MTAHTFWGTAFATNPHAHACNCIGCCKKCGECRTSPWHARACDQLAALREQRAEIIRRACA